jgi:hypothetical protein
MPQYVIERNLAGSSAGHIAEVVRRSEQSVLPHRTFPPVPFRTYIKRVLEPGDYTITIGSSRAFYERSRCC